MSSTTTGLPTDWQEQVINALIEAKRNNPSKAIWGVSLPEHWVGELRPHAYSGELRNLFGIRAVSFSGKTIGTFEAPKETPKSKKVG